MNNKVEKNVNQLKKESAVLKRKILSLTRKYNQLRASALILKNQVDSCMKIINNTKEVINTSLDITDVIIPEEVKL